MEEWRASSAYGPVTVHGAELAADIGPFGTGPGRDSALYIGGARSVPCTLQGGRRGSRLGSIKELKTASEIRFNCRGVCDTSSRIRATNARGIEVFVCCCWQRKCVPNFVSDLVDFVYAGVPSSK